MPTYDTILFDLDGTLTDPKEGITKSIQYALSKMNIEEPNLNNLLHFIGPPLVEQFMETYDFAKEEATQALTYYRERFSVKGLYENVPYEGIELLLKRLKEQNITLAVATSKPTVFAVKILEHFQLAPYFDVIVGSELDGRRTLKADVIAEVLLQLQVQNRTTCLMIGDRKHDIIGAKANDLTSVSVLYGYGSLEEHQQTNPTYIVSSVEALQERLMELIS